MAFFSVGSTIPVMLEKEVELQQRKPLGCVSTKEFSAPENASHSFENAQLWALKSALEAQHLAVYLADP